MKTKKQKILNIAYISSFFALVVVFSLSFLFDSTVMYKSNCYSFLRELSTCEIDWAIGNFSLNDNTLKTKELRNEIREANNTYGFFRETLTSHIVASNQDAGYLNFECSFNDVELEPTRLITLSDFCDGNTSPDGKLYTIPLQLMFVGNYCDISKYADPSTVGSSYIPIDMANAIISINNSFNDYSDLLGKIYYINGSPFTINNIFYQNSYLAPLFFKYYGKFIVADSSNFLDDYDVSITAAYKADSISQDDYIHYFKNKDIRVNNFTYLKSNNWQDNAFTSFVKKEILSRHDNNQFLSPVFWVLFFLLLCEGVLLFFLLKKRIIFKRVFWVLITFSLVLLLLITIGNLFLHKYIIFLNLFNGYLTVHAVINVALLAFIPMFRQKLVKNLDGRYYDINL